MSALGHDPDICRCHRCNDKRILIVADLRAEVASLRTRTCLTPDCEATDLRACGRCVDRLVGEAEAAKAEADEIAKACDDAQAAQMRLMMKWNAEKARADRLAAAGVRFLAALREPHGQVFPSGDRSAWNPDYHLDITVTVADAWALIDALAAEPKEDGRG